MCISCVHLTLSFIKIKNYSTGKKYVKYFFRVTKLDFFRLIFDLRHVSNVETFYTYTRKNRRWIIHNSFMYRNNSCIKVDNIFN